MIMNLLFTAICLAFVFVVTADIQAVRPRPIRVKRERQPDRKDSGQ